MLRNAHFCLVDSMRTKPAVDLKKKDKISTGVIENESTRSISTPPKNVETNEHTHKKETLLCFLCHLTYKTHSHERKQKIATKI